MDKIMPTNLKIMLRSWIKSYYNGVSTEEISLRVLLNDTLNNIYDCSMSHTYWHSERQPSWLWKWV